VVTGVFSLWRLTNEQNQGTSEKSAGTVRFLSGQMPVLRDDNGFQFPVSVEDPGSATFNVDEKAILLMRYIPKHLERTEAAREAESNDDQ